MSKNAPKLPTEATKPLYELGLNTGTLMQGEKVSKDKKVTTYQFFTPGYGDSTKPDLENTAAQAEFLSKLIVAAALIQVSTEEKRDSGKKDDKGNPIIETVNVPVSGVNVLYDRIVRTPAQALRNSVVVEVDGQGGVSADIPEPEEYFAALILRQRLPSGIEKAKADLTRVSETILNHNLLVQKHGSNIAELAAGIRIWAGNFGLPLNVADDDKNVCLTATSFVQGLLDKWARLTGEIAAHDEAEAQKPKAPRKSKDKKAEPAAAATPAPVVPPNPEPNVAH